jgi:hypothetical protein
MLEREGSYVELATGRVMMHVCSGGFVGGCLLTGKKVILPIKYFGKENKDRM